MNFPPEWTREFMDHWEGGSMQPKHEWADEKRAAFREWLKAEPPSVMRDKKADRQQARKNVKKFGSGLPT